MVTSFIALLPEQLELNRVPVIYLFHGLTDNCTGWTRYTSVERYARDHSAAVIMPEVQRSYYTDMAYGMKYFTYVHDELPRLCRHMFGLSDKRELNYVMGLSMGGCGALKCALTTPERYAGCAAFSAVADFRPRPRADGGEAVWNLSPELMAEAPRPAWCAMRPRERRSAERHLEPST